MLTALKKNGDRICLGDGWGKADLQVLRNNELFYCPLCRENVILKLGEKRVFHFSHLQGSSCLFEYERESEYHMNGKLQLYHWLKQQGLTPEMEYYDPKIKQRADIIFFIGRKKFALEYQCSSISEESLSKRTKGYLSNGYSPIWILGGNQFSRCTAYISSLSDLHYLFLQSFTSNIWTIPYYCSVVKKFILLQSIQPISSRRAFTDQKLISIEKINMTQLLSSFKVKNIQPMLWVKELQKWKQKQVQFQNAYHHPFLRALYENNLNLFLLPPYIGLPIRYSPYIMTPPIIWQSYLFIDVFLKWNIDKPIKFHNIYVPFMKRIFQKHIQVRQLPLLKEGHISMAVQEYLQLLVNVGFFKRVNSNTFLINKPIDVPNNVNKQRELEEFFYKKYEKSIFENWT
ncbi:competence protein CoiA [Bacillus sp. CGMCC 1.16607]|uniref:competence protein CoiA n=1 Tax=Bacillus sp. CGMCC 1.16607 TaxID=3351842 RepID=UPI0036378C9E